ncbi:NAD(P)/FAD-dependent oxidoreductase [Tepidanaerobacter sp. GT38]|uniref:NAD(P)/FAD-dependent oxidoreductase n=1 Tax=Tepidanaerobacter sp. GT38 TaxID=2722793 RepID=UPI001F296DE5|nr:FAD-dependent oxidoreductase [Tepidanaerobacter sp. GT38]MCG1011000.1 NAD(P)/FAD-dependent oxidoreductase [Tepidanaerobacter sp. GT38]
MNPIVIIGNGISSVAAAEAFRKHDKDTPIVIFGDEPYYAYYRIRLSGLIGDTPNLDKLYIRKPEWYRDLNIKVNLNQKVISIDPANNEITLENGNTFYFSKLLIASGSSPFVPPIQGKELAGVFSIRSMDDVITFNDFISDKTQGAVIGGGLLGLEIAWSLAKKGKKVHVIEGAPHILFKQLDETAAEILTDLGKKANINFIVQEQLNKISGKEKVTDIQLGNGETIPVEFVVFATGVRSNIDFVKNTSIQSARGIVVDEYMQTSVKDIYAAGDVAEYKGQVYGIWPVAQEQGKTAGLNMAGQKISYSEVVPSNYLKVFDVEIYSIGDLCKDGKPHDTIKSYSNNIYRVVFFKDNIPVGAILFGDVKPAIKISKAIKARTKISDKIIKSQDFEGFLKECDGN